MPTYEYKCESCGESLEVLQKITADSLEECPKCGKKALLRSPGGGIGLSIQGSGFYATDCCPCGKNKGSCGS